MPELNRKSPGEFKNAPKNPVVIVLDNVRSMNNIGSVFRTADAFLLQAVYLCGITATPPHREIQKTALGATETVDWNYFPSTLEAVKELKNDGFTVYAVEQAKNSIMLNNLRNARHIVFTANGYIPKIALIFGNEVSGVEQQVIDACAGCIEIPQYGTKHSLNLAVCVGIVAWYCINL